MDKTKDRNGFDLDRALQGTWVVVGQRCCHATEGYEQAPDYSDSLVWWRFRKGEAVFMDIAYGLRIDYTYRIEGDLLTLHAVDTDTDYPDEPELYRVTTNGKYATFSAAENGNTDAMRIELMKI